MFIDTHAHLNDEAYKEDLLEVIDKCKKANIGRIIVCGYNMESNKEAIRLASEFDFIYAAIAIHPENVLEMDDNTFTELEEMLKNDKVIAVGECGLDYYWTTETKELQKEVFKKQIELAINKNLPVLIHARDAIQDTYDILKGFNKPINGIMHGYSGSVEMAKEFIKLGLHIGVGGVVTFKNAKTIKEVVNELDLSNFVLETDCPYLTPHPFRGKRNDPSLIPYIANEIANIKGIEISAIEEKTTNTVYSIFKGLK